MPAVTSIRLGAGVRLGIAFTAVHVVCLLVLVVGWSPVALLFALAVYLVRGFAVTGVFHRLLAHGAYSTSRVTAAIGAAVATSAAQRGPLWWVAQHRRHHRNADGPGDPHSPERIGFWRAHCGWQFQPENQPVRMEEVEDLARFPELRFLDRYHYVAPVTLATLLFVVGYALGHLAPSTATNGPQVLIWAFFITTVAQYHVTFSVNSFGHRFGRRRFETKDTSRNNWLLAVFTLGEGWHNNHHRFASSARQGFSRAELDPTHALLRLLARLRLVHDLRPVPAHLWAGTMRRAPRGTVGAPADVSAGVSVGGVSVGGVPASVD